MLKSLYYYSLTPLLDFIFSENKENQSYKPNQKPNQNLKNQQSGENIE